MHGADRVLAGFSVNDTMAEFRALRASVLRLWRDANPTLPQAASDQLTWPRWAWRGAAWWWKSPKPCC